MQSLGKTILHLTLGLLAAQIGSEGIRTAFASEHDSRPTKAQSDDADSAESLSAASGHPSAPAAPVAKKTAPAFHNVRYEEAWPRQAASDGSLKYIPLSESGNVYLSLGGQFRLRTEFWDAFAFADNDQRDDVFALSRIRLHTDLYVGPNLRFFIEGKSAFSSGRNLPGGDRLIDVDHVDILNALVDIKLPAGDGSFTFRLGRQELQLGKQRLISPLDWANTRRSFDAVRGIAKVAGWRIDTFWARLVQVRKYDFNTNNSGNNLFGAYLSGPFGKSGLNGDFYWLGLDRRSATFGGASGEENRHSVGARLGGGLGGGFDFDMEGTYQFGDHADRDISAAMFASQVGYSRAGWPAQLRLTLGFDYASGDGDPNDGTVGTFNQLFPLAHAYLGFADVTARMNNVDVSAGFIVKPSRRLTVRTDLHQLWRASERDALYNAGGGVVRSGGEGTPLRVGAELDVTLIYKPSSHWVASFGVSRVFAGPFIEATGPSDDIHFAHVGVQYTF